jgi:hypothetical protein
VKNARIPDMKRIQTILLVLIALLLPFHGLISVALPDGFQFWKEVLIGLSVLFLLGVEFDRWSKGKTLCLSKPEAWALGFLIWIGGLVAINIDISTAIVAARYLGMGLGVFFIFSRLLRVLKESEQKEVFQKFALAFLISCGLSVLMGIWAKFFGGFEMLSSCYSSTISSWVPGQLTPLYHEVDGFIRMQGGSSGPIEFANIILMAFFLLLLPHKPKHKWSIILRVILGGLFLFAIFQSASRIAFGLAILGLLFTFARACKLPCRIKMIGLAALILLGAGFLFGNKTLNTIFVQRVGTIEHFSRPVEAVQKGFESPLIGKLGELGPAARAKNLRENNDDKALIAENVFADTFAQTGLVGFILLVGFFVSLFLIFSPQYYPVLVIVLLAMNGATLFDMVPISMAFCIPFAFFATMGKITMKKYFV